MDSGISSLLGVVIGASLTLGKDWFLQHRKDRRDLVYLAAQVATKLERFTADCYPVAFDDGEDDEHGLTRTSTEKPRIDVQGMAVEWRLLPSDLLLNILDLPYQIELADEGISMRFDHDNPPDFSLAFEERQHQYATLGLKAAAYATELRAFAKIRALAAGSWDPVQALKEKIAEIEEARHKRRASDNSSWHIGPPASSTTS